MNLIQPQNFLTETETPPIANVLLADAVSRPILFSTPMVNAIHAKRKIVTRRILKVKGCKPFIPDNTWDIDTILKWNKDYHPYGKVGDILWVRETFAKANCLTKGGNEFSHYVYKADNNPLHNHFKWKPSLFMPKSACRLFLEITEIKVERLQDITEDEAKKEGIENGNHWITPGATKWKDYLNTTKNCYSSPITSFQSLWAKINGIDSWDVDPFVWVISFKLVECPYGFR